MNQVKPGELQIEVDETLLGDEVDLLISCCGCNDEDDASM